MQVYSSVFKLESGNSFKARELHAASTLKSGAWQVNIRYSPDVSSPHVKVS